MRILREADAVDIGGGVVVDAGDAAGEGGGGEAAVFDWNGTLPANLPDSLKQFKGKSFQDVATSAGNAQAKIGEQGSKIAELAKANEELQVGLKKAQDQVRPDDDPEFLAAKKSQSEEMLQRYNAATLTYMETGEVDDDLLGAIEETGVRLSKETLVEFMEFQKSKLGNTIDNLVHYAAQPDTVTKELTTDVVAWLKSGESPFTPEERVGFERMMAGANPNFAWFDTVLDAYNEEFGAAPAAADVPAFRRKKMSKKKVRGRPILTPENQMQTTAQFQEGLIAIRSDKTTTTRQKQQTEREYIAKRRVQLGE